MSELVDFLRARYAERRDEASLIHELGCAEIRHEGRSKCDCGQPEAIVVDLDAKLAVLKVYEDARRSLAVATPGTSPHDLMTGATNTTQYTLKLLAQPFAGHPDHAGEEWAP